MGKKHASQYVNFGWLRDFNLIFDMEVIIFYVSAYFLIFL